ncbi:SEC14 cytosolic factor [Folsomia candida]|uniref:SEC14 cytosolic factor n=2 Tax=Folsomia candida TaxID=158441 RepID=A0A226F207_FOLCA|nr:SEC14 cytosolic factor [Folsomia candida]
MDPVLLIKTVKTLHHLGSVTYPNFYKGITPTQLISTFRKAKLLRIIKHFGDDGKLSLILLFEAANWDPTRIPNPEMRIIFAFYLYAALKIAHRDPRCSAKSRSEPPTLLHIFDTKGFSTSHAKIFSFRETLISIRLYNALPKNVTKCVIFRNSGILFEKTYSFVKWLLPYDMRKMIHVCSDDISPIFEHVPVEGVPKAVGGLAENDEVFLADLEKELDADGGLHTLLNMIFDRS